MKGSISSTRAAQYSFKNELKSHVVATATLLALVTFLTSIDGRNFGVSCTTASADARAATHEGSQLSELSGTINEGTTNDRLILVYPLDGCEATEDQIKGHSPTQILQGRSARDMVMKTLQQKTSEFIRERYESSDRSFEGKVRGYAETASALVEEPIKSRYLEGLQMEVITSFPAEMRDIDLKEIAESLPCVHKAYQDQNKYSSANLKYGEIAGSGMSYSDDKGFGYADTLESKSFNEFGSNKRFLQTPISGSDKKPGSRFSIAEVVMDTYENRKPCEHQQCANRIPDDELFPLQWNLHEHQQWSSQAEKAWRMWTGTSNNVTVAVIDSGCSLGHPELKDRLWKNTGEICDDGIDNDGNGYIDDCYGWDFVDDDNDVEPTESGHGTAAASIIAASANNALGLAGICWGCKIMCLKFIGRNQGTVSNQVQAIDYAVRKGARISNNSYGGYGFAEIEFEAIKRAQLGGHLFVASAGNNNLDTDMAKNDHTPSSYALSNIISVGASTKRGTKAFFSNYGANSVHLFAPGTDIQAVASDGQYRAMCGTSFAAPHVAAAAALLWSAFPALSYESVKEKLINSCKKSETLHSYATCGGILDSAAAVYQGAKLASAAGGTLQRPLKSSLTIQEQRQAAQAKSRGASKNPNNADLSSTSELDEAETNPIRVTEEPPLSNDLSYPSYLDSSASLSTIGNLFDCDASEPCAAARSALVELAAFLQKQSDYFLKLFVTR